MLRVKPLNLLSYFPVALLVCVLTGPVVAQQSEESNSETAVTESSDDAAEGPDEGSVEGSEESDVIEDILDVDLDEQTYEEDDDDFIPTEEIPADEPIPFPSNI